MAESREEYLDFYREWLADARAICEELDEPMELILPLLCTKTITSSFANALTQTWEHHAQWSEEQLRSMHPDADEPWKDDSDS